MPKSSTALDPNFQPKTKQQALAVEIAKSLEDTANFAYYVFLANRYKENYLRRILGMVMETPEKQIKRSRAAFFVYLVKHYRRS